METAGPWALFLFPWETSQPLLATHPPRWGVTFVGSLHYAPSPSAKRFWTAWQFNGSCSLEARIGWDLKDVHPTPFICHLDIVSSVKPRGWFLPKVTQQAAGGARITAAPTVGEASGAFFLAALGTPSPERLLDQVGLCPGD